jgi:hypothetical protein
MSGLPQFQENEASRSNELAGCGFNEADYVLSSE